MKGLELAERFFHAKGLAAFEVELGDLAVRAAYGLVGDGSDCFGFDDEKSRDHDWGPGFCVWLDQPDFQAFGDRFRRVYGALPRVFEGFGPRWDKSGDRVGVFSTEEFYAKFTGLFHPPRDLDQWLMIPENALAAATNGRVFRDETGAFSSWRKTLAGYYPEDVRLKKMASRAMTMGQSGQYNFMRCASRGEYVAARYAETKYLSDTVSMVFLMNRQYAPFYKWMHRAMKNLPVLGREISEALSGLVLETEWEAKAAIIENIAALILEELREEGLSRGESDFLVDHGPFIQEKISDPGLRARNVWVG